MKRYLPELKEQILAEIEETKSVPAVSRKHQIPVATLYSWLHHRFKKTPKRLADDQPLIDENRVLKKKLADQNLELMIMRDLLKKTYQIWPIEK